MVQKSFTIRPGYTTINIAQKIAVSFQAGLRSISKEYFIMQNQQKLNQQKLEQQGSNPQKSEPQKEKQQTQRWINAEIITYVFCGVLTTLVDWLVFALLNEHLKTDYRVATALSWLCAVIFAYIVNKLVVFKNYQFQPARLFKEWWSFFAARAVSGVMVMVMMVFFVDVLLWKNIYLGNLTLGVYLAKAIVSVINLVVNYVLSKWWIFKKR